MLKEDLQKLDHVVYRETEAFIHLHCEEGYYLTDWSKEDIKDFSGSPCWYIPYKDEFPNFYTLNEEEYSNLIKQQDEYFKKEEEQNKED